MFIPYCCLWLLRVNSNLRDNVHIRYHWNWSSTASELIQFRLPDCFRKQNPICSKYDGHNRLWLLVQILGVGGLECGQNQLPLPIHGWRIQFKILVHCRHWFPWETNGMRLSIIRFCFPEWIVLSRFSSKALQYERTELPSSHAAVGH